MTKLLPPDDDGYYTVVLGTYGTGAVGSAEFHRMLSLEL